MFRTPKSSRSLAAVALSMGAAGCCATATTDAALLMPPPAGKVSLQARIDELPMDGRNIVREVVSDTDLSTAFLVRIDDREHPHQHSKYDLTVIVVDGSGTLWLDGVPLAMNAGDVAHVARGVAHHFVNNGKRPASAIAVFSPKFDGPDSEPIEP